MRLSGWRIAGNIPNVPKYVLIVAPHTSNWDFFHGFCAYLVLRLDNSWLAKHTVFFWPLGILARRFGGMPIDRSRGGNVVRVCVAEFARREKMSITITPEGTRGKVKEWKLGFYYIATEGEGAHRSGRARLFEPAREDHGAVHAERRRGRGSAEDQGAVFGRHGATPARVSDHDRSCWFSRYRRARATCARPTPWSRRRWRRGRRSRRRTSICCRSCRGISGSCTASSTSSSWRSCRSSGRILYAKSDRPSRDSLVGKLKRAAEKLNTRKLDAEIAPRRFNPTGDAAADLPKIKARYTSGMARFPENF